jgi:hypothetical protein
VTHDHGLVPFPRHSPDTVVPAGLYHVAIDCVDPTQPTNVRDTQAGYNGLLVTLLVSVNDGKVWDARASRAW